MAPSVQRKDVSEPEAVSVDYQVHNVRSMSVVHFGLNCWLCVFMFCKIIRLSLCVINIPIGSFCRTVSIPLLCHVNTFSWLV